jgi:hypothetical protein
MAKNKKLIITFLILVLVFLGLFGAYIYNRPTPSQPKPIEQKAAVQNKNQFSYQGEEGKDALTLLQSKAKVELATSGLVASINGRKANDKKHEYWAFYVNGKLASVGPKDYVAHPGDKIEWKIETY